MTKKRAAGASPARGGARSPRSPRSSPSPAAAAAPATPEASGRPIRIYADGVYDLFHTGHMRQLQQCKELFPNVYLLVGVCSDELTHKYKGKTVMTDEERYEAVSHCRWVDEVVRDAPWVVDAAFIEKHQIDFIAHDDLPYPDATGSADDAYGFVKSIGKFAATQRTEGISTSDLILRLIRDYNEYVLRNLSRGYTRQELGVSFVREKQLRLEGKLQTAKARMKERARRFWADHAELSGAADALASRFIGMFKGHPGPRARARLAALLADVRRERA